MKDLSKPKLYIRAFIFWLIILIIIDAIVFALGLAVQGISWIMFNEVMPLSRAMLTGMHSALFVSGFYKTVDILKQRDGNNK